MKSNSYKAKSRRLHELASAQGGYFTAKQAQAAGYAASTQSYNVKAGNWRRDYRGIYFLANYPHPDHPDLIQYSLWSSNRKGIPEGVYSHQTVLSLHDLSDINPSKIHMTVPPTFRRSGPIPGVLHLHRGVLRKDEVQVMHGFRATRPLKAIGDLLTDRTVSMDHMAQAVKQAFSRGLIGPAEFKQSRIPDAIKKEIETLRKS